MSNNSTLTPEKLQAAYEKAQQNDFKALEDMNVIPRTRLGMPMFDSRQPSSFLVDDILHLPMHDDAITRTSLATVSSEYVVADSFYWNQMREAFHIQPPPHIVTELTPEEEKAQKPKIGMLKREALCTREVKTARGSLAVEAEKILGYSVLSRTLGIPNKLARALVELDIRPFDDRAVNRYKKQMELWETKRLKQANQFTTLSRMAWIQHPLSGYRMPVPEFVLNKAIQIKQACPEAMLYVDQLNDVDPFLVAKLNDGTCLFSYYVEVWDEPKFEDQLIDE